MKTSIGNLSLVAIISFAIVIISVAIVAEATDDEGITIKGVLDHLGLSIPWLFYDEWDLEAPNDEPIQLPTPRTGFRWSPQRNLRPSIYAKKSRFNRSRMKNRDLSNVKGSPGYDKPRVKFVRNPLGRFIQLRKIDKERRNLYRLKANNILNLERRNAPGNRRIPGPNVQPKVLSSGNSGGGSANRGGSNRGPKGNRRIPGPGQSIQLQPTNQNSPGGNNQGGGKQPGAARVNGPAMTVTPHSARAGGGGNQGGNGPNKARIPGPSQTVYAGPVTQNYVRVPGPVNRSRAGNNTHRNGTNSSRNWNFVMYWRYAMERRCGEDRAMKAYAACGMGPNANGDLVRVNDANKRECVQKKCSNAFLNMPPGFAISLVFSLAASGLQDLFHRFKTN